MILINDDCLSALKTIPDNCIDSLVTDPPAGISFMGKEWDSDRGGRDGWIKWMSEVMRECLRVMKPGAHGLVWAIPRTSHWTATALEDAGFEVRDVITHLFGSGFPKSLDVSKAIDKAAGAEREVVAEKKKLQSYGANEVFGDGPNKGGIQKITAPATDAAKQWQGWGTALKPASEHWILVRKPCAEKTIAANVLEWGTGGLNIDDSRIGSGGHLKWEKPRDMGYMRGSDAGPVGALESTQGRFPANLVLSHSKYCTDNQCDIECAIKALDEQSGQSASRFFYCAKISTSERNAGLDEMPSKELARSNGAQKSGSGDRTGSFNHVQIVKNHHPTVKPKKLMSYLCKLITPPGGVVLDPFMGSGSTGIAAKSENFDFVGIEKESEYFQIAQTRINNAV